LIKTNSNHIWTKKGNAISRHLNSHKSFSFISHGLFSDFPFSGILTLFTSAPWYQNNVFKFPL